MLTPLLLVEPQGTFMVCITQFPVIRADASLVTPQYEPVLRGKQSVQMVTIPVPE